VSGEERTHNKKQYRKGKRRGSIAKLVLGQEKEETSRRALKITGNMYLRIVDLTQGLAKRNRYWPDGKRHWLERGATPNSATSFLALDFNCTLYNGKGLGGPQWREGVTRKKGRKWASQEPRGKQ